MEGGAGALEGKVAIVTGAAMGIGEACARLMAARGARVVVTDIDADGAEAVASDLRATGADAFSWRVNIAEQDEVTAAAGEARDRWGRIDVLVNNAASGERADGDTDVVSTDLDLWDRVYAVNVRGTLLMSRAVIPTMIEGGGGSIVNMASVAGLFPTPGVRLTYSTTKAAVIMMTRHTAASFGKQGVRCNVIAPGRTRTQRSRFSEEEGAAMAEALYLTPYLGETRDIAEVVGFLASDASRFVTGAVIPVDGGSTAFRRSE